jgi:gluconate kinase
MRKPLVVYVSGAPGAGKTSLAHLLSQQLYIPHVSSDLVHGGVRLTQEGSNERRQTILHIFVPLLVHMATANISFVVDHVLQKGISEEDVINKLKPHATVVYIHVKAENAVDRFYDRERMRADRGVVLTREELQERRDFHKANLIRTENPLDLGIPCLEVDTNAGYEPDMPVILDFIEKTYSGEEKT